MKLEPQQIEIDIDKDKYRAPGEETKEDVNARVVNGVAKAEGKYKTSAEDATKFKRIALEMMNRNELCPAGRQLAGAGLDHPNRTLVNCYVMGTIPDSMDGIYQCLKDSAMTMQMGGGIGMDFSTLRPNGAWVKGADVTASGPLDFMDNWDSMCKTMLAAGNRRGAMMATLRCDHPDITDFIEAKKVKGRLTQFNTSVLVTDEFMDAVREDKLWHLISNKPRRDGEHNEIEKGVFIYKTLKARDLWNAIMKTTYDYAEPGVIFIDRINKMNNLWYCEDIAATNPCGEQPLPPFGACNLLSNNLAMLVNDPFNAPTLMLNRLKHIVEVSMRFLDNVLDITPYPLEEQELESINKRRTGLGIMGLANMLQQMKIRYGSEEAIEITGLVMKTIRDEAYRASINLAKERGPFPLFKKDDYLKAEFIKGLPNDIREGISTHGIRNSLLLTAAPTGTTAIRFGNVSSSLEPTFGWHHTRKVLQPDGTRKPYPVEDYGYRLYKSVHKLESQPDKEIIANLPDYMVTIQDLTIDDHLKMQAVIQENVDSSTSKTTNMPEETSFEDFQGIYIKAYDFGLKGCTTYRPNPIGEAIRGSVLSIETELKPGGITWRDESLTTIEVPKRPEKLIGSTYKLKWPESDNAFYVTVNDYVDEQGLIRPFEVFINSKDVRHQEWITAITLSISAIFRRGGDVNFIIDELQQVYAASGGAWIDKKYVPSLVALIGGCLAKHVKDLQGREVETGLTGLDHLEGETVEVLKSGGTNLDPCPKCYAPALVHQDGCSTCQSCFYSTCG